ncbi:MAG: T9SS type A sorting domain-containing protein [Chitinophagaceae bacterium]|nr:T9SS type A sorting domain-containing protein [Chitinophagaceae bacterium]
MDSSFFDGLTKLHFPSDSIGYAVGYNGIIIKIENANTFNTSIQLVSDLYSEISIFPNPSNTLITIRSQNPDEIFIYNNIGQMVLQKKIKTHQELNQVNVSLFPSGIYLIKSKNKVVRFIKL